MTIHSIILYHMILPYDIIDINIPLHINIKVVIIVYYHDDDYCCYHYHYYHYYH